MAVIEERLEAQPVEWSEESCACVVMASGGYPGKYDKGIPIEGWMKTGRLRVLLFIMRAHSARTANFLLTVDVF